MIEDDFIFNEDPFDDYDPIPEILEDPVPTFEPEPPIVIDEPEPPLPSSPGSIGWPCACTGLYI